MDSEVVALNLAVAPVGPIGTLPCVEFGMFFRRSDERSVAPSLGDTHDSKGSIVTPGLGLRQISMLKINGDVLWYS